LNNPLKFTDPSGLYARQKHYEKEGGSEGTYIPFDIPPVYFQAGFSCYSSFDLSNNIETLLSSHYGGYCSDATGIIFYKSPEQALVDGMYYVQGHNGWKDTEYKSMEATVYDYLVENTNIFDLASLGGGGNTQNEGGAAFSWSGTIAIGPVGFTFEAGVVGDNQNGSNTFFTAGLVHGWEASFQFNYYKISGNFRAGDWAGRGIYGDVGYGWFSIGKSANRGFDSGFEYFPVSYTATKYGYGPCIGFTSFGRTTTTLGNSDIINYIPMYPPTPW
jgi:hypothetical protein